MEVGRLVRAFVSFWSNKWCKDETLGQHCPSKFSLAPNREATLVEAFSIGANNDASEVEVIGNISFLVFLQTTKVKGMDEPFQKVG